MSETPRDHLLDHEYDGIREYDNPPPSWWSWIFLGTVLFSVVYFFFFQFSPIAWTNDDLYRSSVAANLRQQFAEIGDLSPDAATIVQYMDEPEWLTVGETVYKAHCKQCHADDGSGLVGPNLTDELFVNVEKIEDIATVIVDGANNGAMPAWDTRLHINEIVLVSSYVARMRGQNLPGVGHKDDKEIPPWPTASQPTEESSEAAEPAETAPESS